MPNYVFIKSFLSAVSELRLKVKVKIIFFLQIYLDISNAFSF